MEEEEIDYDALGRVQVFKGKLKNSYRFYYRNFPYRLDDRNNNKKRNQRKPTTPKPDILRCAHRDLQCKAILKLRPGTNEVIEPDKEIIHTCNKADALYPKKKKFEAELVKRASTGPKKLRDIFEDVLKER